MPHGIGAPFGCRFTTRPPARWATAWRCFAQPGPTAAVAGDAARSALATASTANFGAVHFSTSAPKLVGFIALVLLGGGGGACLGADAACAVGAAAAQAARSRGFARLGRRP